MKTMTNGEKYKTAEERTEAFLENFEGGYSTPETVSIFANWLENEAEEEKPLPCPFCEHKCVVRDVTSMSGMRYKRVECTLCEYRTINEDTSAEAIAAHNRVAKLVIDEKEREENNDKR